MGYKAQFSALQGRTNVAVSTSLAVLLKTNERISMWFNVALVALAAGATLMCFVHLSLPPFIALVTVRRILAPRPSLPPGPPHAAR